MGGEEGEGRKEKGRRRERGEGRERKGEEGGKREKQKDEGIVNMFVGG